MINLGWFAIAAAAEQPLINTQEWVGLGAGLIISALILYFLARRLGPSKEAVAQRRSQQERESNQFSDLDSLKSALEDPPLPVVVEFWGPDPYADLINRAFHRLSDDYPKAFRALKIKGEEAKPFLQTFIDEKDPVEMFHLDQYPVIALFNQDGDLVSTIRPTRPFGNTNAAEREMTRQIRKFLQKMDVLPTSDAD